MLLEFSQLPVSILVIVIFYDQECTFETFFAVLIIHRYYTCIYIYIYMYMYIYIYINFNDNGRPGGPYVRSAYVYIIQIHIKK